MSFKQFGGLQFAAKNNIVGNHYSTSSNLGVSSSIGQENSKIISQSHIDLSANSLLHIGALYFMDGSIQTTAYQTSPTQGAIFYDGITVYSFANLNCPTAISSNLVVSGTTALNGGGTSITPTYPDNSNQIATTAYVKTASGDFATLSGTNAFTGNNSFSQPTALNGGGTSVTLPSTDNSTGIATTAYVNSVGFATLSGTNAFTGSNSFSQSTALNGGGTSVTPSYPDDSTKIATTAYVKTASADFATLSGTNAFTGSNSFSQSTALNGGGTSVTPSYPDNTTNVATTAYVTTAISNIPPPSGVATDISGGQAGEIPFQSAPSTTTFSSNLTFVSSTNTLTSQNFNATSDYRIKEDVQNLDETSITIDQLRPILYKNKNTHTKNIGFLAHEVQEIFPFLVQGEKDGEQIQSINYIGLIGVLVKEIQDLKKQVLVLEEKIDSCISTVPSR